MKTNRILVTGATGYVGGRLIPALLKAGYRVRALVRNPEKAGCRPWALKSGVELVQGDVLDCGTLVDALTGCRAAYYLVHSMIAQKEKYAEADRQGAKNMAAAAAVSGIERIIYLGGLAETRGGDLSKHLTSRIEVADILQAGDVPTTVLRTPVILGSGSASFEIMRYLVERLPIMTTPRWVRSMNQPIAIRNVIIYLVGCLEKKETIGQSYDIGGPDILSYRDLLDLYAEEAGLAKRLIIPLPVLTPTLSALWIHLISPVPKSIAMPLTEGLTSHAVCTENRIHAIIPQKLLSCRETIRLALDRIRQEQIDTCWMDAGLLIEPEWSHCGDAQWAGGTILTCGYRILLTASVEDIWKIISSIGGNTGWFFGNSLWRLRGLIDRFVGGVGLRRGRRHPTEIGIGDALDFWRVLDVKAPSRLLLVAEMKTPGEALLEFTITDQKNGSAELQMLSRFLPKGLLGIAYWYALYPFHQLIFAGMLKSIARKIEPQAIKPGALDFPQRFTPKLPDSCRLPRNNNH